MSEQVAVAEGVAAFEWIRNKLLEDATILSEVGQRIYPGVAPSTATYPFITMQILSSEDKLGVGGWILWSDTLVLVRGTINQKSITPLKQIVRHIHTALHKESGPTTDAYIVACTRQRPHVAPTEESNGQYFSHAGGEYLLKIRPPLG